MIRPFALTVAAAAFAAVALTPRAQADGFAGRYFGTLSVRYDLFADDVSMKGVVDLPHFSVNAPQPPEVLFAPQAAPTLFSAVVADGDSFARRKFRTDDRDPMWADRLYDLAAQVTAQRSAAAGKRKKPNVGIQPGDITSATPKGRLKSKKSSLVLDVKLNYSVEGTITTGENAGKTFRGKLKLRFKGDREVF